MSSKPVLKIDWINHEASLYACKKFHYSKKIPVNKLAKMGVWEDEKFVGAVIFSCGSAGCSSYSKTLGIENTQIAELARVALTDHKTGVTRILRIALSILKKSMSGLRVLVSYADREQGHHGGIYQGGNWCYVGLSSKDIAFIDKDGKRHHSRNVSETGYKVHCGVRAKRPKPSDMEKIIVPPKHKYLMPLDEDMKKQIAHLSKPYPKRANNQAVANPATLGGEIPTRTLQ